MIGSPARPITDCVFVFNSQPWCLLRLGLLRTHHCVFVFISQPSYLLWLEFLQDALLWLYVLIMSRTCFIVNPHSIVARMSRNSLLETGAKSEVLSDCNWTRTSVRLRTKWFWVWVQLQSLKTHHCVFVSIAQPLYLLQLGLLRVPSLCFCFYPTTLIPLIGTSTGPVTVFLFLSVLIPFHGWVLKLCLLLCLVVPFAGHRLVEWVSFLIHFFLQTI